MCAIMIYSLLMMMPSKCPRMISPLSLLLSLLLPLPWKSLMITTIVIAIVKCRHSVRARAMQHIRPADQTTVH